MFDRFSLLKKTLQRNGYDTPMLKNDEATLNEVESSLKNKGIKIPKAIINPNITKAQLLNLLKIFLYTFSVVLFILIFMYIISTAVELTVLKEVLLLVGINLDNILSAAIKIFVILFLVSIVIGAMMVYVNLYKKTIYFYNNEIEYYEKGNYQAIPYKDVVSVNYSKNFFKGDSLILKLTGGEQKIEVNFVDDVEEKCRRLNEIVKSS
ncbi:MAG: DUF6672 family protein [Nanoarchaeota archaeon]